jgi:hypothetical protein
MPMVGTVWGSAVSSAVQGLSVPQDRPLTTAEVDAIWQTICGEHVTHITGQGQVFSNGATLTGPPGGPLPITLLPGTIL